MNIEESIILVVDDKPTNLDVLFNVFEQTNYDVLFASDGQTCINIATDEYPNLILLDIMMPGMSGFEVCQHLKAAPRTADGSTILSRAGPVNLADSGRVTVSPSNRPVFGLISDSAKSWTPWRVPQEPVSSRRIESACRNGRAASIMGSCP